MRNRYVLLLDLPLVAIAAFGAFAARFDWQFYETRPEFIPYVLAALVIKPGVYLLLGMYRRYWRYASVQELLLVLVAVTAGSGAMALVVLLATILGVVPGDGFSRVVLLNDWILSVVAAGGLRFSVRMLNEPNIRRRMGTETESGRRILIVGAGDAGTMVAREMRRNPALRMQPIGYLDDDHTKIGKRISGLPVFGKLQALPGVVRENQIESVVIAMPKAKGKVVRDVVELCHEVGITSQTMPGVYELLDGQVSVNRLRNVEIVDLLRRAPVNGDAVSATYLNGQVVLITGAGGSIGSELARQVANVAPSRVILLGHGENSLFEAAASLAARFPHVTFTTAIADIRDPRRLELVFDRFRPSTVFHAAAHKHVPLMEENPQEAISNNVLGTKQVVDAAISSGVHRFVLISTDKAVAPSNVMGASKRIAELIVQDAATASGRPYVVVRFGNVLGSRGSVVPIFQRQIERGGPVTVTDPLMRRFFMTIPEAAHLVVQAGGMGLGGELFVLNMGQPVKIVDLARDLIRLTGSQADDIPIVFTGVRPGEKLDEELWEAGAVIEQTDHPEVLRIVEPGRPASAVLAAALERLKTAAYSADVGEIHSALANCISSYSPVARSPLDGSALVS